jgi:hypothetical protein
MKVMYALFKIIMKKGQQRNRTADENEGCGANRLGNVSKELQFWRVHCYRSVDYKFVKEFEKNTEYE